MFKDLTTTTELPGNAPGWDRMLAASAALFAATTAILYLKQLVGPTNVLLIRSLGVAMAASYLVVAARSCNPNRLDFPRPLRLAFGCWLAFGLLSVAFAEHRAVALIRESEWIVYALVAITLAGQTFRRDALSVCLLWIVITGVLVVIAHYALRWFSLDDPRGHDWIWYPRPFIHLRHFGCFVAAGAIAALWPALAPLSKERRPSWHLLGQVLFTLQVGVVFWTGGRAAILAVALAAALVLWLAPSTAQRRTFIRRLPIMLVAAWVLSWLFVTDHPYMGLSLTHGRGFESMEIMSSRRLETWANALHAALASPLWGVGPDNYLFLPGKADNAAHPHNLLVQAMTDWGLFGAFAFVALLVAPAWWALRRFLRDRQDDGATPFPLALLVVYGMLASLVVNSMLDGPFYHYPTMAIGASTFGLVLGYAVPQGTPGARADRRSAKIVTAVAVVALAIAMLAMQNIRTVVSGMRGEVQAYSAPELILVRAFPVMATHVPAWWDHWADTEPGVLPIWLDWLQRNSMDRWRYYLTEADWAKQQGDLARAAALTERALAVAPMRTREALVQALNGEEGKPKNPD